MRTHVAVVAFVGCVRVWRRSNGRLQFGVLTNVFIDSAIDSLSCSNFLILMKKYSYLRMQENADFITFSLLRSASPPSWFQRPANFP